MKINAEFFPIKQMKNEDKTPERRSKAEKTDRTEDIIALSNNNKKQVMEENRKASETALPDFKKAVEEVYKLKSKISEDTYTASEIHQLESKRVLFLALD